MRVPLPLAHLVAFTLAFSPAPAAAHAKLLDSEPPAEGVAKGAPASVLLRFDGRVERRYGRFELVDAAGTRTPLSRVEREGAPENEVTVGLPRALPPGAHRLEWSVVSRDGHRVEGVLSFTVSR